MNHPNINKMVYFEILQDEWFHQYRIIKDKMNCQQIYVHTLLNDPDLPIWIIIQNQINKDLKCYKRVEQKVLCLKSQTYIIIKLIEIIFFQRLNQVIMAKEKIKKDSEEIKNITIEGQDNFIQEIYEIGNFQLQIQIKGPDNSPYKSYSYFLNFQFSNEYPQVPPQVTFMNKIFHPNINILGYIYLGILRDDWRSDYTIKAILMSIKSILETPILTYSFFPEATELYKNNREEFQKKAKDWAEKFAIFNN